MYERYTYLTNDMCIVYTKKKYNVCLLVCL